MCQKYDIKAKAPILTKKRFENNSLDKIEQLETAESESLTNFRKRAWGKGATNSLTYKLLQVKDTKLKWAYYRTFRCSEYLYQNGLKVTTKYCGYKWCLNCNRIRTAKLINGYKEPIEAMNESVFLTLTIPSVGKKELYFAIDKMYKQFGKIVARIRKRHSRGKTHIKVNAVRKFECNHNEIKRSFNPHFHIIIDGLDVANEVLNEWLKDYPLAKRDAGHKTCRHQRRN